MGGFSAVKLIYTFSANKPLENVSEYKYLGVYFNEHLDFNTNATTLCQASGRALGGIVSKYKQTNFMGYSTYTKLYENCVIPVMNYCSGVWGYKKFNKTDQIQQRAMRIFLGVHKFTPIASLYGDMNWLKPQYKRWIEIIRLWNRFLTLPEDRLTKQIFEIDYSNSAELDNWCSKVCSILTESNHPELFHNKQFCNLKILEDYLFEKQKQEWKIEIANKPKLRFYKSFKDNMSTENYVKFNLSCSERSLIAQLRMGILPIAIETGRFINLPIEERICNICDLSEVEDEWHFIFRCTCFTEEREQFFNNIVRNNQEFIYLDEENQMKYLFNEVHRTFAKYIKVCFDKRKRILFV